MQGNKLYVGNLSYSVTDEQLEELFSNHSQVKSANVIGNKGFGFVELADASEAEKAKEAVAREYFPACFLSLYSSPQLEVLPLQQIFALFPISLF